MEKIYLLDWVCVRSTILVISTSLFLSCGVETQASTNKTKESKETWLKYCDRKEFIRSYVIPNRVLSTEFAEYLNINCRRKWNGQRKCKQDKMYPFLTFYNSSEHYVVGAVSAKPKEEGRYDCWMYYLQVYSARKNKVVFHKYFSNKTINYNQGTIGYLRDFKSSDYADEYTLTLSAFPDGGTVNSRSHAIPKNYCQKIARYELVKLFWVEYRKRNDCHKHFVEGNMQAVAESFCSYYKNTTDKGFIVRTIPKDCSVKYCIVSFIRDKLSVKESGETTRYLWLAASVVLLFVLVFLLYKCFTSRKKKNMSVTSNMEERMLSSESESTSSLPLDTTISVMILHRPGCELLDSLVRDLSYVIHLHGIEVTSPLLEMSQIDAEGGIATYIQRNIDTCTYVIVVVTESNQETLHRNHKPFEFSMKMLSGLAFRDNDCSRYIPVYIKEYKEILTYIPAFLAASRNCGYRIPDNITEMMTYMKKTNTIEGTKEHQAKLTFFMEKLKVHVRNVLQTNHKNCCQGACLQGTIADDVSELWPGTNSDSTKYSMVNKERRYHQSLTTVTNSDNGNINRLDLIVDTSSNLGENTKQDTIEQWRMFSLQNSDYFESCNKRGMIAASMPYLYPKTT